MSTPHSFRPVPFLCQDIESALTPNAVQINEIFLALARGEPGTARRLLDAIDEDQPMPPGVALNYVHRVITEGLTELIAEPSVLRRDLGGR